MVAKRKKNLVATGKRMITWKRENLHVYARKIRE